MSTITTNKICVICDRPFYSSRPYKISCSLACQHKRHQIKNAEASNRYYQRKKLEGDKE